MDAALCSLSDFMAASVIRSQVSVQHTFDSTLLARSIRCLDVCSGISGRSKLPANLAANFVAADVSPFHLVQNNVRADSRRLLRFRGSRRDKIFRGILFRPRARNGRALSVRAGPSGRIGRADCLTTDRLSSRFHLRPRLRYSGFATGAGRAWVRIRRGRRLPLPSESEDLCSYPPRG